MSERSEALLALSDVHVRIAGSHILQGIDLAVAGDGVTALLGRNGVGKTTTLKAILGIVPRTGSITLNGARIDGLPTHRVVRSGIGYVPEDREVFASLTVEENLRLAEQPGVTADYDTVHALFPELRQRRRQRAGSLSGGQQQMVALAGCCCTRPPAADRRADQGARAEAGRRGRRRARPGRRARPRWCWSSRTCRWSAGSRAPRS